MLCCQPTQNPCCRSAFSRVFFECSIAQTGGPRLFTNAHVDGRERLGDVFFIDKQHTNSDGTCLLVVSCCETHDLCRLHLSVFIVIVFNASTSAVCSIFSGQALGESARIVFHELARDRIDRGFCRCFAVETCTKTGRVRSPRTLQPRPHRLALLLLSLGCLAAFFAGFC